LGNNWDYRLAFLVLIVPQVVEWMRSPQKTFRLAAWLSLILVLLSCWHLRIVEIPMEAVFRSVEDSRKFWIILDEIFNWMLFASLAYLLVASLPGWIEELSKNLLAKLGLLNRQDHEYENPVLR
jgi:hypothetical protein